MAAIFDSLELNHDKVSLPVQSKQVYASAALLPLTKLFLDDHQVRIDGLRHVSEQWLEVSSFMRLLACNRDWRLFNKRPLGFAINLANLEQRHGVFFGSNSALLLSGRSELKHFRLESLHNCIAHERARV
jgi:hypothetical protein